MGRTKRYYQIPGQSAGYFDPQGMFLRTDRYPDFAEALRRVCPFLELGWDRSLGRWVLIRQDPVVRRVAMPGSTAGIFTWVETVYTVVHDICWCVEGRDGEKDKKHYREPDNGVLCEIAESEKERYAFLNHLWAEKTMRQVHDEREAAFEKEFDEEMDGLWEEAEFHLDTSSSTPETKIRGVVPANYGSKK